MLVSRLEASPRRLASVSPSNMLVRRPKVTRVISWMVACGTVFACVAVKPWSGGARRPTSSGHAAEICGDSTNAPHLPQVVRAPAPFPAVLGNEARPTVSLGADLRLISDVDGDGRDDILCAAPLEGRLGIVSTRTYRTHWVHDLPPLSGYSIDACTVVIDGRLELLVGATTRDGVLLLVPRLGRFLPSIPAPDWDGVLRLMEVDDGNIWIAKGVRFDSDTDNQNGSVFLQPLASEFSFQTWRGNESSKYFGTDICALRSGKDERFTIIVVGTIGTTWAASKGGFQGYRLSGQVLEYQVAGAGLGDGLGWRMLPFPDQDGDGCEDLLAAIPCGTIEWEGLSYEHRSSDVAACVDGPGLSLFSGRSGRKLWNFRFETDDPNQAYAISVVGDIDGDGVPEVASTRIANLHTPGTVTLYSVARRAPLWSANGPELGVSQYGSFGRAVDGGSDLDGDGVPDVVVGAGYTDWQDGGGEGGGPGHIYVYSGMDGRLIHVINEL